MTQPSTRPEALTDAERDQAQDMIIAAYPYRKFIPFVQNEPAATVAQKDALRAALAAGTDAETVRLVRGYFNACRASHMRILAVEVRAALAILARR